MSIRFDGRVAIVTGAGGGLGRCYALELARRGAKVVVNDLGGALDGTSGSASMAQAVADEITAAGGVAVANHDSVADRAAAQRMVDEAVSRFGSLDILVNNAGILRDKSFVKLELDDFQRGRGRPPHGQRQRDQGGVPRDEGEGLRAHRPHHLLLRSLRELRADQLRCGQAGPGGLHEHPQARRGEVRHQGQLRRTDRRDPDDQEPVVARGARRDGPREGRAGRRLPLQRGQPQRDTSSRPEAPTSPGSPSSRPRASSSARRQAREDVAARYDEIADLAGARTFESGLEVATTILKAVSAVPA